MKYMFERIAVSIVGLGLSLMVAILGMYLVFNAELRFLYHLLYSAAFILQPVMTFILIRYMFRRPAKKKPAPADYDYLDEEDEEDTQADEKPAHTAHETSYDSGYTPHETVPDDSESIEHRIAEIPDPAGGPVEDSSLAGAIGRKFSGLFGGSHGDDL